MSMEREPRSVAGAISERDLGSRPRGAPEPTLLEIAADPKHLGARIGVLAVFHT
jgi:hypothetical protein